MRNFPGLILVPAFLFVFAGDCYPSSLKDLESLPYLAWSEKPDQRPSGVVRYDKNKAFDGYNIYYNNDNRLILMDMAGKVIHHWELPGTKNVFWCWWHAQLLKGGDIVAANACDGFIKIDKASKLIWKAAINVHHDIESLPDGSFLVPAIPTLLRYNDRCVSFDSIVHVSMDGRVLDQWSTYDHLKVLQKLHFPSLLDGHVREGDHKNTLPPANDKDWDSYRYNGHFRGEGQCDGQSHGRWYEYYHLNSIQALPETALGLKDRRFQKGNWLVCFRNVDLILILDKDTREVVWSWGQGILDWPHMPRMLSNGNILMFDNGFHRSYSRLIIVDPAAGKIVWEYKANPPENFHSRQRGSGQQLPNGNFLICESDRGRVFEITPQGEIVWEFLNPRTDKKSRRMVIYRMIRVPKQEASGWLGQI